MFYFIHVLAGAVIARYFPSIFPIIILSLVSHFILDIIPHRDNLFYRKVTKNSYKIKITKKAVLFEIADASLGIFLMAVFYLNFLSLLMIFSIFVSLLPDIIKLGHFALKDNKLFIKYMYFHSAVQTETGWILGIITQLIVTLILLKFLF